ncbi:hypothetical protein B484DRAFT_471899, partial [Ochromonadaceae sp. CCMP2298]
TYSVLVWADVCPISSDSTNEAIDQRVIRTWVNNDVVVRWFFSELARLLLQTRTDELLNMPVLPICGDVDQLMFNRMADSKDLRLVLRVKQLSADIWLCETIEQHIEFLSIENFNHPSYVLISANEPVAKQAYDDFCETVIVAGECARGMAGNGQAITEERVAEVSTARGNAVFAHRVEMQEGRVSLTKVLHALGINSTADGRFDNKLMHLRHMPAYVPEILAAVEMWGNRGTDSGAKTLLVTLLTSGRLYMDLRNEHLEAWYRELGENPQRLASFMCGGVACRIGEPAFDASCRKWLGLLGGDEQRLASFMCDGVAKRICEPAFNASCREWLGLLGDDEQRLASFMCDGVACRIGEPAFDASCLEWLGLLGGDERRLTSFMCNSLAKRICEPAFDASCREWLGLLGGDERRLTSFMCNGVACRIGKPAFDARCLEWLRLLGGDEKRLSIFMCESVAKRICEQAFDVSCRGWLRLLGGDEKRLATFMCNGVAKRIGVQDFDARCLGWLERFGGDV